MIVRRLSAPGITAEYARLAAGEDSSITEGDAVGVAFLPIDSAGWMIGGSPMSGAIAPGSVFITPAEGLAWTHWDRMSESVEMWLDPEELGRLSRDHGGPSTIRYDLYDRIEDPVIANIASGARTALWNGPAAADRLEALGLALSAHLLERLYGLRISRSYRPLDGRRLKRVTEYMRAHLEMPLPLARLADIAAVSPFHFVRRFKAATGSPPHAFVLARRMEHAAILLRTTGLPVTQIATACGFSSLPQFRNRFRMHWGTGPAAFRGAAEPDKIGTCV